MKHKIIEKDGKKYLMIGEKAIPFDAVDENGKPIIRVESETIQHPDGRQDVNIFVDCLNVLGENKEIK